MCLGHHGYCARCSESLRRSSLGLQLAALPSGCFARYAGSERWIAIRGGEAAHWLAHELGVRGATRDTSCAAGFALARSDVIAKRQGLHALPVPGDLWVDLDSEGCGRVTRVQSDPVTGPRIWIRHLRSAPARVCEDDFYAHFSGRGGFFR
jgi:hypothetical protein